MTGTTLARHLEQTTFGKILVAWARWEPPKQPNRREISLLLDNFPTLDPQALGKKFEGDGDVDLCKDGFWIVGPPVQRGLSLFPVATACVTGGDGGLDAWIRVALLGQDDDGGVHAWGWRFDSAERASDDGPVPRPHPHAQPIRGWNMKDCECLLHPHTASDIRREDQDLCPWGTNVPLRPLNETHPAFPLLGSTIPGLAMAFVVSLYGVEHAREILDGDPGILSGGGAVISRDIAAMIGS